MRLAAVPDGHAQPDDGRHGSNVLEDLGVHGRSRVRVQVSRHYVLKLFLFLSLGGGGASFFPLLVVERGHGIGVERRKRRRKKTASASFHGRTHSRKKTLTLTGSECRICRITSGTVADLPDLGIVRDGTPCGTNLVRDLVSILLLLFLLLSTSFRFVVLFFLRRLPQGRLLPPPFGLRQVDSTLPSIDSRRLNAMNGSIMFEYARMNLGCKSAASRRFSPSEMEPFNKREIIDRLQSNDFILF